MTTPDPDAARSANALRATCISIQQEDGNYRVKGACGTCPVCAAADLIESQAADNARLRAEVEALRAPNGFVVMVHNESDFGGYWESQGLGGDHLKTYLDQLAWYDAETRQDPYVLGFTVFTAGDTSGNTWDSFDVTDVLPALARYLVAQ